MLETQQSLSEVDKVTTELLKLEQQETKIPLTVLL